MTAGCANRMAQSANPPETDVDIDRTATVACGVNEGAETSANVDRTPMLGRELATRDCGVDEGDGTERRDLRLQQTIFYCEERHQLNENTMDDIPIAYELPLEGEWSVYSSDELDTLIIVSIEPESTDSGEIPHVCLGGTRWRVCNVEGLGDQADGSSCETDGARHQTDASRASNRPEMAVVSHNEGAGTYLGAGGAKGNIEVMDGVERHVHTSTGHGAVPSVKTDAIIPARAPDSVSIPRKRIKPPDLPSRSARTPPDEPDGCGNHTDALRVFTDGHNVETESETSEIETGNVRIRQNGSNTQYLQSTPENGTPKRSVGWKWVSVGDGDVYLPLNMHIMVPSRKIVFGEVESIEKAIAPIVKGERAGDGSSDRNGDDGDGRRSGDVDSTTSGGSVHSKQVNAALLAVGSQHMRQRRRSGHRYSPVSSRPPIRHPNRPYGDVRCRRRRGRIKTRPINVSQTLEVEKTYLKRTRAAQPCGNDPIRAYGVIGPRRRRGRIKIESINVSQTEEVEMTYHGRTQAAQPRRNAPERCHRVHRPKRRRGRIKFEPRNVSRTQEIEETRLGRVNAIRSIRKPKKHTRRLDGLTFEYRMPGEPWRDVEDHG